MTGTIIFKDEKRQSEIVNQFSYHEEVEDLSLYKGNQSEIDNHHVAVGGHTGFLRFQPAKSGQSGKVEKILSFCQRNFKDSEKQAKLFIKLVSQYELDSKKTFSLLNSAKKKGSSLKDINKFLGELYCKLAEEDSFSESKLNFDSEPDSNGLEFKPLGYSNHEQWLLDEERNLFVDPQPYNEALELISSAQTYQELKECIFYAPKTPEFAKVFWQTYNLKKKSFLFQEEKKLTEYQQRILNWFRLADQRPYKIKGKNFARFKQLKAELAKMELPELVSKELHRLRQRIEPKTK